MNERASASNVDTVLERMTGYGDLPALYAEGREFSYRELMCLIDDWGGTLDRIGVERGTVVGVLGEFSPRTCALLFALLRRRAILVPFTKAMENDLERFAAIAGVALVIEIDADDVETVRRRDVVEPNRLVEEFLRAGSAGLVVFTSGSTGEPKGILHNCEHVFKKFLDVRPGWRTILFLLMDHFGGFNTFVGAFAYGGLGVCVTDRSPTGVCRAIEGGRATLLPTTPTFLNLLLASNVYRSFDLSSVRLITYGTEVMPEATLTRVRVAFPNAEIKQTYGLSELGVLRSKSEGDSSVWVRLGGSGFETKIEEGVLWVRSEANMVGYLNAPSPFDAEGWMCTGDHVEVRGDLVRILGRKSDMINVGGQKVFPSEIETVLLEAPNVSDATVYGLPHPVMGNIVAAKISLYQDEPPEALTERLRAHCAARLQRYKIPMRFSIVDVEGQHTDRFKKARG